uniref:Myosin-1-like n=1 Tax=Saccoglossus kowalevskii TaxID=10224 RepID=A0ABM0GPY6_SACKO|nr:PREDICTED: myosin-1-like [Saccoglossus kowalevskii]
MVLAQLHETDKALADLVEYGEGAQCNIEHMIELANSIAKITELSESEVAAIMTDLCKEEDKESDKEREKEEDTFEDRGDNSKNNVEDKNGYTEENRLDDTEQAKTEHKVEDKEDDVKNTKEDKVEEKGEKFEHNGDDREEDEEEDKVDDKTKVEDATEETVEEKEDKVENNDEKNEKDKEEDIVENKDEVKKEEEQENKVEDKVEVKKEEEQENKVEDKVEVRKEDEQENKVEDKVEVRKEDEQENKVKDKEEVNQKDEVEDKEVDREEDKISNARTVVIYDIEEIVRKAGVKVEAMKQGIEQLKENAAFIDDDDIDKCREDLEKNVANGEDLFKEAQSFVNELKTVTEKLNEISNDDISLAENESGLAEDVLMWKKKIEDVVSDALKLSDDTDDNVKKVKEMIAKEKETKLALRETVVTITKDAESHAEEVEKLESAVDKQIGQMEQTVKSSGLDESEFLSLIKEIKSNFVLLQEETSRTKESHQSIQNKADEILEVAKSKSNSGKIRQLIDELTKAECSQKLHAAKKNANVIFECIQKKNKELKLQQDKALMNDDGWKLLKEVEDIQPSFDDELYNACGLLAQCKNLAYEIEQDSAEHKKLVKELKEMVELLKGLAFNLEKSIKQLKSATEELTIAKSEQEKPENEEQLLHAVQTAMKVTESDIGKVRTNNKWLKGLVAIAESTSKRQTILNKIKYQVKESHSAQEETHRLYKEVCTNVDTFKREVEDSPGVKLEYECEKAAPRRKTSVAVKKTRRVSVVSQVLNIEKPNSASKQMSNISDTQNALLSLDTSSLDDGVIKVNPEIYRDVEKMERTCRDNNLRLKELTETAETIAQEAMDKYKRRESEEEMKTIFDKAEKNFTEVHQLHGSVQSLSSEIKQFISDFLSGLALKKAAQDAKKSANVAEGAVEWLNTCAEAAMETAKQALCLKEELDKYNIDDEHCKERLESIHMKSKVCSEKAKEHVDKSREHIKAVYVVLHESGLAESDIKQKSVELEKMVNETNALASTTESEIEECHKVKMEVQKMINTEKRSQAVQKAQANLEVARDVLNECNRNGKDAIEIIDTITAAVEDCGRDTDEARKAIEHVIESLKYLKESTENLIKTNKASSKVIDKLHIMTRQERFPAEEIDEKSTEVNQCTTVMKEHTQTVSKATSVVKTCFEEMKQKNPKSWACHKFYINNEETEDQLLCVIRTPPGVLDDIHITCSEASNLMRNAVGVHDQPFSHVVKIEPQNVNLSKFALVAIPFDTSLRGRDREIVVKTTVNGKTWKLTPTNSTDRSFDEFKGKTFAEVRVNRFSTFFVLSRLVRENARIERQGGNLTSSIERRVSINFPPQSLRTPIDVSLELNLIDAASISQLRERHPSCIYGLDTCSPIVFVSCSARPQLVKPMTLRIPLLNSSQKLDEKSKGSSSRPSTQQGKRMQQKDATAECVPHVLARCANQEEWKEFASDDINMTILKNDVVEFQLENIPDALLLLMSPPNSRTSRTGMATALENWTRTSLVNVILHQHDDERDRMLLQIVLHEQCDLVEDRMIKDGYVGPPDPSSDIELREEQEIVVKFTGNICRADGEETRLTFYKGRTNRVQFLIKELNLYRNFASDCHIGTAQVYVCEKEQLNQNEDQVEINESLRFVEKMTITLPKAEPPPPRPKTSCKTAVKLTGPLSEESLKTLARELGEDYELLAPHIGFDQPKIQRVKCDNQLDTESQAFDMLISWRNSERRSADKIAKLCRALEKSGRSDLCVYLGGRSRTAASRLSVTDTSVSHGRLSVADRGRVSIVDAPGRLGTAGHRRESESSGER